MTLESGQYSGRPRRTVIELLEEPQVRGIHMVIAVEIPTTKFAAATRVCDHDLNNDGLINFGDLSILKSVLYKSPGPSGLVH